MDLRIFTSTKPGMGSKWHSHPLKRLEEVMVREEEDDQDGKGNMVG